MGTVVRRFIIQNQIGLHARPAARFVQLASSFTLNSIWIQNLTRQSNRVRATSLIMVLSISALQNDEVEVTVEGEQAEITMQAFVDFFDGHLVDATELPTGDPE